MPQFSPWCPLSSLPSYSPVTTQAISGFLEYTKPVPSSVAVYLMFHSLENGSSVLCFVFPFSFWLSPSHPKVSNVPLSIYVPTYSGQQHPDSYKALVEISSCWLCGIALKTAAQYINACCYHCEVLPEAMLLSAMCRDLPYGWTLVWKHRGIKFRVRASTLSYDPRENAIIPLNFQSPSLTHGVESSDSTLGFGWDRNTHCFVIFTENKSWQLKSQSIIYIWNLLLCLRDEEVLC